MKKIIVSLISLLLLFSLPACGRVNWMGENPVFRENQNELPAFAIFTNGKAMYQVDSSDFFLTISYEDESLPAKVQREIGGIRCELEYVESMLIRSPWNLRVHVYENSNQCAYIAEDGRTVYFRNALPYPEEVQTQEECIAYAKELFLDGVDLSAFSLRIETRIKTADGNEETIDGFYSCAPDEELLRREFFFKREIGGICVEDFWFSLDKKYGVSFWVPGASFEKADEERLLGTSNLKATVLSALDVSLRNGGLSDSYGGNKTIDQIEYPEIQAFHYGDKLYVHVETEMYFIFDGAENFRYGHLAYVIVDLEDYLE